MTLQEKLIALNQMGISQTTLAKYCHCHKAVINKLIHNEYNLTEKMAFLIDMGLKNFYNDIKSKIGEE